MDFSSGTKDSIFSSNQERQVDQSFSKALSEQSAAFLSSSFSKSSDAAAKLAEQSASWIQKTAPEPLVEMQGEAVAGDQKEGDPLTDEIIEQPVGATIDMMIAPLLPIIEMKMINGVVPFVAGPDAMGVMFKASIESRYKDIIQSIVVGTPNVPGAKASQAELSKAVKTGGWWSK
jgi:hypothetical protein